MKTFQRPNYALYFQNEDRVLSELSKQDVLLIRSSMNETELQDVWVYHPSQRDWIPLEQNEEITSVKFVFQRNVKSPQPRLPHPGQQVAPSQPEPSVRPAVAARPAPQPAAAARPAATAKPTATVRSAAPAQPAPSARPQASAKPSSLPVTEKKAPVIPSAPTTGQGQTAGLSHNTGSGQSMDVQRFGILAKAAKFPKFQAQVVRLDSNSLHTNQPWPFAKGQSGVLKLQYLNQSFTLQGSVDKNGDGKVLVLEPAYDYVFFQDFLHILGVA